MNKITLAGLAAAIVVLLLLSYIVSGAPDNATLLQKVNPLEAAEGFAFSLAFGGGVPEFLAYIAAAVILLAPATAAYAVVTRIMRSR